MMSTPNKIILQSAPWYQHRWPWLLMAGPMVVIIAGFITMWISFSGADALVVDDYYKQGKAINQDLRREAQAKTLGLQLAMHYDPSVGQMQGRLSGVDKASSLTLLVIHPTLPAKDMRFTVQSDAHGKFAVILPLLERAHWQIELQDSQRTWRLHGRWDWPTQKEIEIQP
jgi:hypothetical protein